MAKQITVGMHEAKTHFSKLVKQVQAGEEVVVENYGKPVAKIVSYDRSPAKRKSGLLKGKIVIKAGFDDPVPGFEEFYE